MTRPDHHAADPRTFVFGSNVRGFHGAGAARYARVALGAQWGVGEGLTGRAYALPTCSSPGVPLLLADVDAAVRRFIVHARRTPGVRYYVSEIGCGYAGYTAAEIAPLFAAAPDNCDLPPGWRVEGSA